ncbi:MAG: hypothetical protein RIQ33_1418, partial [Bacteroidota bacterium]
MLNKCPLCKNSKIEIAIKQLADISFQTTQLKFDLWQCNNCSVYFQNPFIDEKEVGAYYPSSDYHPFQTKPVIIPSRLKYHPPSIYLRFLMTQYKPTDSFSLIDVGCGGGTFLWSVKQLFPNAKLLGSDVSDIAIKNLNQLGIEGINCSFRAIPTSTKFDVIVSSQVIEHLNFPDEYKSVLKNLAHKDSIVMIDTPAADSYSAQKYKEHWIHWDLPRHSIIYTHASLTQLFSDWQCIKSGYGGSLLALMSCYKRSKGQNIYHHTLFQKLILKIATPIL